MGRISQPVKVDAPGTMTIHEHICRVATGDASVSVARLLAPPGWEEPFQQPTFVEITIVSRGLLRIEHAGGAVDIGPGETAFVNKGERIRYSNPFEAEAEYGTVCLPAYSRKEARRDA